MTSTPHSSRIQRTATDVSSPPEYASTTLLGIFSRSLPRRRDTRRRPAGRSFAGELASLPLRSPLRAYAYWSPPTVPRVPRARLRPRRRGRTPCTRSEEHTSELQSHSDLVCRPLLEKK